MLVEKTVIESSNHLEYDPISIFISILLTPRHFSRKDAGHDPLQRMLRKGMIARSSDGIPEGKKGESS